jgi:hypothetical protein
VENSDFLHETTDLYPGTENLKNFMDA